MSKINTISSRSVIRTPMGTKYLVYKQVPAITLSGVWLQEIGFQTGNKILVESMKNKIIIKTLNP